MGVRGYFILRFAMASNQQHANPEFPIGIGAGNVHGGAPPISDPQARAAALQRQPLGNQFRFEQTQSPLQPQPPHVSGAAEFQQPGSHDDETPWQRIIREGVAGPARSPQGQQEGPGGGGQPQAGAYPHNVPQMARDPMKGIPQHLPQ